MKPDWDAFVKWLSGYLEIPTLPIEWSRVEKDGFKIVRLDLCPGKPYQVTSAVEDRSELCTSSVAYELAMGLRPWLIKAIETRTPYTYFRHFGVRASI